MRDRWSIGSDGFFLVVLTIDRQTGEVIAGPDIVTKGFVPEQEGSGLIDEAKARILAALGETQSGKHLVEAATLRDEIHNSLSSFLYERTKRRPMVLPVVMQV